MTYMHQQPPSQKRFIDCTAEDNSFWRREIEKQIEHLSNAVTFLTYQKGQAK